MDWNTPVGLEWLIVAPLVGAVAGQFCWLLWDMWRHPRSRWAEDAARDIEAAKARELERRARP
jgi:hypothetical protein